MPTGMSGFACTPMPHKSCAIFPFKAVRVLLLAALICCLEVGRVRPSLHLFSLHLGWPSIRSDQLPPLHSPIQLLTIVWRAHHHSQKRLPLSGLYSHDLA